MEQLDKSTQEIQNRLDLIIPKASGVGYKVDETTPTFPWQDIIGLIMPDYSGVNAPTVKSFRGDLRGWAYGSGDKVDCVHHIPHDYVLAQDCYVHVHWKHNGTAISGDFGLTGALDYGDRDGIGVAPIAPVITYPTVDIATTPQYAKIVTEIQLSSATPSATQLDSGIITVDGLVESTWTLSSLPTITGGDLFISTIDIHYQSTGIGTKNSGAPFYG